MNGPFTHFDVRWRVIFLSATESKSWERIACFWYSCHVGLYFLFFARAMEHHIFMIFFVYILYNMHCTTHRYAIAYPKKRTLHLSLMCNQNGKMNNFTSTNPLKMLMCVPNAFLRGFSLCHLSSHSHSPRSLAHFFFSLATKIYVLWIHASKHNDMAMCFRW